MLVLSTNALVALVLGAVLAVGLLVPVVAVRYRRAGRLGPLDLLTLFGATAYGFALWTYTLLPLPSGDYTCQGHQLEPFATVAAIDLRGASATDLLTDPAISQVVLNVAFFVPLGVLVRQLSGRGVVVATLLGLAVSLLIETTQGTGVWGLFPCPFRLLDVDDLLLNTLGAALGSLLALPLLALLGRGGRGAREGRSRPGVDRITLGRRWTGMVCDVVGVLVLGTVLDVAWRALGIFVLGLRVDDLPALVDTALLWGVPGALQAVLVLGTGRTLGEHAVLLRAEPTRAGGVPLLLRRLVKLVVGVGGAVVLAALEAPWSGPALLALLAVTAVAPLATRERRGLAQLLSGQDLVLTGTAERQAP